jgi:hypothetical protein
VRSGSRTGSGSWWSPPPGGLLSLLPGDGYRVAMLVHPNVFAGHGTRQVHGWLSCCRRRGLAVVPPEADWQALLIAADWIIGDHGSLTAYGTLTDATMLLTAGPRREVAACSPAALLSSAPGRFHRRMRSVLYGMLGLGEPARPPFVAPPPPPPALTRWEISAGSGAA